MASKNEYYDRIISSLQSDLTSQKTEISELKSTVVRQQKEIEALKSAGTPPPNTPIRERLTTTDKSQLLQQAKKECAILIQSRLEILSSQYTTKREFDTFQTTITKTYLPAYTFTSYKKAQETRLKSIEDKLNRRFSIFSSSHHNHRTEHLHKTPFHFNTIIQFFKTHNHQWLIRILVCAFICFLAMYMLSSIS